MDKTRPALFGFQHTSDRTWIFSPEHPSVGRFGSRLYEVLNGPSAIIPVGREYETWLSFCANIKRIYDFDLDESHMPMDLWAHLNPQSRPITQHKVFEIDVAEIKILTNPFKHNPWCEGAIEMKEVAKAIAHGKLAKKPVTPRRRCDQIRRIAFLVQNPDDWTPIEMNAGMIPGQYQIVDGYHRIAAAIFLDKPKILSIFDGMIGGYNAAFPNATPIIKSTSATVKNCA